jgi:hypothetical protein
MLGEAGLEVRKSDNDQIRVQVTKQARGETKKIGHHQVLPESTLS